MKAVLLFLAVAILCASCEMIFPGLPDCPECPTQKPSWTAITFYGVGVVDKKYDCYSADYGHAVEVTLLNYTPLGTKKILLYNVPEDMITNGRWINFQGERINENTSRIHCHKDTTVTEQYYVSTMY